MCFFGHFREDLRADGERETDTFALVVSFVLLGIIEIWSFCTWSAGLLGWPKRSFEFFHVMEKPEQTFCPTQIQREIPLVITYLTEI